MRHIDPQSDLADGIELAPPPDRRPDGTVIIPPQRAQTPPRPSLCTAGPCRNYHRFATQVDAANPRAVRLPIAGQGAPGALYQAPATFHVEVHHWCYPTAGVEMALGSVPVTECNRWDPDVETSFSNPSQNDRRDAFKDTESGKCFARSVQEWEAARGAEMAEAAEAERLMAGVLEDEQSRVACQFCGGRVLPQDIDKEGACGSCRLRRKHLSPPDKDVTP